MRSLNFTSPIHHMSYTFSIKQATTLLLVGISMILTLHEVCAQQVIINSNGQRVVVYPDGSWRLFQEADSLLLKNQLAKEQVYNADYRNETYENLSDNPGELTSTIHVARQFADLTLRQSREANRELARLIDEKFEVEARLRQAEENKSFIEPDQLANLEDSYDQRTKDVKEARKHQKEATAFAEEAQNILDMPTDKRAKALNKVMVKHSAYYAGRNDTFTLDSGIIPTAQEPTAEVSREPATSGSSGAVWNEDDYYLSYRRKPVSCLAVVNEADAKGKTEMLVIARRTLFKHTDPDLRPYFRNKDLVTCSGQLSQIGDAVYLNLEFSIASPNAKKNFGVLPESSLMRLTLVDGTEIDLVNLQGDGGRIDPYSGHTLFVGRYLLENANQKRLSKVELDKMRVVWTSGYEDYDIFAVDFLVDQFECLKSYQ